MAWLVMVVALGLAFGLAWYSLLAKGLAMASLYPRYSIIFFIRMGRVSHLLPKDCI